MLGLDNEIEKRIAEYNELFDLVEKQQSLDQTYKDIEIKLEKLQDEFDELGQLDDNEPMTAQVKDQAYTLVNSWQIPDLSMRFLESGSVISL